MRALRRLLGLEEGGGGGGEDPASLRPIAAAIEALPREEGRRLSAIAFILARVAHVDLDVSEAELERMAERVQLHCEIGPEQAAHVVAIARAQQVDLGGTENYVVARQLRTLSTRAQCLELLRCLFEVAAVDEGISETESREITQIGAELGLTREEVVAVRSEFRDRLAVLRDLPRR